MALRGLQGGNYGTLIAAAWSGSGKTVLACALIRALVRSGLRVAPFKVGPDYIDPGFLETAAGRPCYNLDSFFCPGEALLQSFARGMRGAEVAVVEGVMGLYDGIGGTVRASTAEVAKILGLPVVLILPARSLSTTAAALVKGLVEFEPGLRFRGLILNGVGSSKHERLLRRALASVKVPVVGVVPREETFRLPSRHLGLVQAEEISLEEKLELWAERIKDYVDLPALFEPLDLSLPSADKPFPRKRVVAVARDEAFSFYYRENLDLLAEAGAELVFFSPLRDSLPQKTEALYLGGGYPELFAETLSRRDDLRAAIRRLIREGCPVLAECGGFMFLLEAIEQQGKAYPMMGALPGLAVMDRRLRSLGYREVRFRPEAPPSLRGALARGHEFRYSRLLKGYLHGLEVKDAEGQPVETYGWARGQVLASYIHFHFASAPEVVAHLMS